MSVFQESRTDELIKKLEELIELLKPPPAKSPYDYGYKNIYDKKYSICTKCHMKFEAGKVYGYCCPYGGNCTTVPEKYYRPDSTNKNPNGWMTL